MSLHRGGGWGGVWDTALQNFPSYIIGLIGLTRGHFYCKPYKMLPIQFLTSISILLEAFSQLATCQLPPEPFKEHWCTHETSHGGQQTEEE